MKPVPMFLRHAVAVAALCSAGQEVSAATLSGTVAFPVSDGGYTLKVYGAYVRVMGTDQKVAVAAVGDVYSGTFSIPGILPPDGPVTLVLEEPPHSDSVIGDRFTQNSKRIDLDVSGDASGLAFDLIYHWR